MKKFHAFVTVTLLFAFFILALGVRMAHSHGPTVQPITYGFLLLEVNRFVRSACRANEHSDQCVLAERMGAYSCPANALLGSVL
jgi:hypothetical protein